MNRLIAALMFGSLVLLPPQATGQTLSDCTSIADPLKRLACYDQKAGLDVPTKGTDVPKPSPAASSPAQTAKPRDK